MSSNTRILTGLTLFVTGASRGIGKAIALRAAKDGAKVLVAAKTSEPHPKLPGTIHDTAKEIKAAGGEALPCIVDVRNETSVKEAVKQAASHFGGIDIVINNASAIYLTNTQDTTMKQYDLMQDVDTRGTFLVSKYCIPFLKESKHPHILNISPPLNMIPFWFKGHVAYTIAKYGMSMCVLGMAEELKEDGIACNALWPNTGIYTAATEMLSGGSEALMKQCRKPEIMADAAHALLSRDPKVFTGNFAIDEDILREEGVTNFDNYACSPGSPLLPDIFLGDGQKLMSMVDSSQNTEASKSIPSTPVSEVFTKMKALLTPELVEKTKAVYSFEVKEADTLSQWFINLKEGSGSCGPRVESSPKGDVTLKMNEENFIKMFRGELQPTAAFMSGKLKISGDMGKAMKLEKLMGQMKSKL